MNTPHEPLTPDVVDALLSAQLDGDLDGAAAELGLGESEARSRLAATPGIDARRESLARARDLIAARPPLDAAVEDRLVAAATARDDLSFVRERRGRRQHQWRVLVAAGSVAAAIAVVVGLSTMQKGTSSKAASTGASAKSQSSAADAVVPPAQLHRGFDFGDVTREAALRAPARRLLSKLANADNALRGTKSTDKVLAPATTRAGDATNNPSPAAQGASGEFSTLSPPVCSGSIRQRYHLDTAPVIVGSGTYSGRPVVILIFEGGRGPVAYVVSAADCSLVRRVPL